MPCPTITDSQLAAIMEKLFLAHGGHMARASAVKFSRGLLQAVAEHSGGVMPELEEETPPMLYP